MRTATYNALQEIQHERERQVSEEGWTPEHDDDHGEGPLVHAAVCYAMGEHEITATFSDGSKKVASFWPWDLSWWKPGTDRRRQLVKAGALIVAELERLERASGQ